MRQMGDADLRDEAVARLVFSGPVILQLKISLSESPDKKKRAHIGSHAN